MDTQKHALLSNSTYSTLRSCLIIMDNEYSIDSDFFCDQADHIWRQAEESRSAVWLNKELEKQDFMIKVCKLFIYSLLPQIDLDHSHSQQDIVDQLSKEKKLYLIEVFEENKSDINKMIKNIILNQVGKTSHASLDKLRKDSVKRILRSISYLA